MLNLIQVRQKFPVSPPLDIAEVLQREFRPSVKAGARIAVGVGSRGISNLAKVVSEVVRILKSAGARPFIIPAMGSHGGATPEGQRQLLAEYGVTEDSMGVPIQASMETEIIGRSADGVDVPFAREALKADGIVIVNRIKPHTDFAGSLGSGIIKMMVIGFGKQAGAEICHIAGARLGMERVLRSASRVIMEKVPIAGAVALIEDAYHDTAKICVLDTASVETREEELLAEAKRLMPRLPFDEIDLLIVDQLGKNISGAGMDPNITGRSVYGYTSELSEQKARPIVRRLFVRDITPESHGNAVGIGLADFTTTRLVRAIDHDRTGMNILTALSLNSFKIPMAYATDREAIQRALKTIPLLNGEGYRVVRIRDTLSLENVEVSDAYADELTERDDLEQTGPSRPMQFQPDGNLLPIHHP